MVLCKRCGKPIKNEYAFCYECFIENSTYIDINGYLRFKGTDELVHRWIADKMIRPLKAYEVVHHKDKHNSILRSILQLQ